MRVDITIEYNRLKSNLTTDKMINFSEKPFFYMTLGLTQSHSGELGDIEGFIQLIPGICKSIKAVNNTGVEKIHLKCDYLNGSIVNRVREPILYSFALDQLNCYKIYKESRIQLF